VAHSNLAPRGQGSIKRRDRIPEAGSPVVSVRPQPFRPVRRAPDRPEEIHPARLGNDKKHDTALNSLAHDSAFMAGPADWWEDARWMGVLEKRDGPWLIVEMHLSFAIEQVRGGQDAA
ncbi:MAG: hypothetical protein PVI01_18355, partial [Gemmatimonadales bacterium]